MGCSADDEWTGKQATGWSMCCCNNDVYANTFICNQSFLLCSDDELFIFLTATG